MLRSIGVAMGLCAALWGGAAQADGAQFNNSKDGDTRDGPVWRVAYQGAAATGACALKGAFAEGVSLEVKVFGERNVIIARLTNPAWGSARLGDAMRLKARLEGGDAGFSVSTEAYGFERGVIFMVDAAFVERMTRASTARFDLTSGDLGSQEVDLAEASGALAELGRCVAARFSDTRAAKRFEVLGVAHVSG